MTSSAKKSPEQGVRSAHRSHIAAEAPNFGVDARGSRAFVGNVSEVIALMRDGTPVREVLMIASDLRISQSRLLDLLRLPRSTTKAGIGRDGVLSAAAQDRLYRASRVLSHAVNALGAEAACQWLLRPNRSLGGEAPLALLDTEPGYELVLDTLGRIVHGVVS